MPDVALIVHLNLTDVSNLVDVAADVENDLLSAGHDVLSVAPWARPTELTPFTSPFATSTLGATPPPPTEPPSIL